ncbi:MAG: MFS transporter [Chloroflexi bacterium]|nr:MFS transporter [Chloroflexota bacterium]
MPPRLFIAPGNAPPDVRHNWLATQKEAVAFAPVEAAASFLPVLLARLGASSLQVGLLAAIPNLTGFLLAIPIGTFLQGRRNVVPWYAWGRLVGQLGIGAIGVTLILLPDERAIPWVLGIVAVAAVVGSFANFTFYVVMDGLSGPNGRYELMGRRWGIKAAATALSLPIIGFVLGTIAFPQSYVLVLLSTAVAATVAFRYTSSFRIADQAARPATEKRPPLVRARASVAEVLGERRFLAYIGRHAVLTFGLAMAVPLIPLYYVRELDASDVWIGLIGTANAALTMAGYFLWRGPARRRGAAWVLVPSTLCAALFPAALSVTHSELAVLILVGLNAFCLAGIDLALFDALLKAVPAGQAVRFAAFDQGAGNFAGMTGPLLGAALATAVGIPLGLVAASAVTLLGAGLFAASVLGDRRAAIAATPR